MNQTLFVFSDILRWVIPLSGLIIMAVAWRKFRSPGASLAVTGFALPLMTPAARTVIDLSLSMGEDISLQRWATLSYLAGIASLAGSVVVVLAMRQLISSAEKAEADGSDPQDEDYK